MTREEITRKRIEIERTIGQKRKELMYRLDTMNESYYKRARADKEAYEAAKRALKADYKEEHAKLVEQLDELKIESAKLADKSNNDYNA